MSEQLTIRPYARLLTMLGDQLIKNELIALVELIKNSYDADASWVKVSFINFNADYSTTPLSKIIIEDDGCGMNADILRNHWVNPATPEKLKRKANTPKTQKGRILQGEKGIGRFATFKLGRKITIVTRRQQKDINGKFIDEGEQYENVLSFDFSKYDDDFLYENGEEKDLFLDNLTVDLSHRKPIEITNKDIALGSTIRKRHSHGTIIEISDLKTKWSENKIDRIQQDLGKLQPIFGKDGSSDFSVWIYKDDQLREAHNDYKNQLKNCLENKSVLRVTNGRFNCGLNIISFDLNGQHYDLDFQDSDIRGLSQFKRFVDIQENQESLECGSFCFEFYVFDFNSDSENLTKYYLSKDEKNVIKNHRIYLYRDNVRVMPYGDPEDDWLGIDITRGTVRADRFVSNDQVVGCVYISQEENPNLKDKTNREGLIEEGRALDDFIGVLRLILEYIRSKPFAKYLIDKQKKIEINRIKKGRPRELIEKAKSKFADDEHVMAFLTSFEKSYSKERKTYEDRIYKTENLAAVGLSVETASHDVMLLLGKAIEQQESIIKELMLGEEINREDLMSRLTLVRGSLAMIQTQMKDIQLLFPSTKSKTKNIDVKSIIEKVHNLYKRAFKDNGISVEYDVSTQPLIVKTTDAVLLQVFINLFDNALYWLKTIQGDRKILITIDGDQQRMVFSDNGPGINPDDEDYIFEAFYSGKGEEGRGLGLYIARQLLDRYDYSIDLAEFTRDKKLNGANFVIEFIQER